jgi:hypothetical protein
VFYLNAHDLMNCITCFNRPLRLFCLGSGENLREEGQLECNFFLLRFILVLETLLLHVEVVRKLRVKVVKSSLILL